MSRFDHCLDFVLEREGGYVNDPVDRGGALNSLGGSWLSRSDSDFWV